MKQREKYSLSDRLIIIVPTLHSVNSKARIIIKTKNCVVSCNSFLEDKNITLGSVQIARFFIEVDNLVSNAFAFSIVEAHLINNVNFVKISMHVIYPQYLWTILCK